MRDDVEAAVAAVAAKAIKSRVIYMITGHRALGFGEIAASYDETIARQVNRGRMRAFTSRNDAAQNLSVVSIEAPPSPDLRIMAAQ